MEVNVKEDAVIVGVTVFVNVMDELGVPVLVGVPVHVGVTVGVKERAWVEVEVDVEVTVGVKVEVNAVLGTCGGAVGRGARWQLAPARIVKTAVKSAVDN